ncbi:MAG: hypothetical protein N2C14_22425 [Planctomycetales bacterium]
MRKAFDNQRRLDCRTVLTVSLNLKCRDELIPVLRGLQHLYSQPQLRDGILELVAQDVNNRTRPGPRTRGTRLLVRYGSGRGPTRLRFGL